MSMGGDDRTVCRRVTSWLDIVYYKKGVTNKTAELCNHFDMFVDITGDVVGFRDESRLCVSACLGVTLEAVFLD